MQSVAPLDGGVAEEESGGRRERKKLATRVALRRAALGLVAARGLAHVTVEEIAEAADVSTRTFFNHFACKEDALIFPSAGLSDELVAEFLARPTEEPVWAAMGIALHDWLLRLELTPELREDLVRRAELLHAYPKELLPRQLAAFTALERSLAAAVAERSSTDPDLDLYPPLVAAVAVATARSAIDRWCADESLSLVRLVEAAFETVGRGLEEPAADALHRGDRPVRRERA
jgi:AcrR family transcriptional regulator